MSTPYEQMLKSTSSSTSRSSTYYNGRSTTSSSLSTSSTPQSMSSTSGTSAKKLLPGKQAKRSKPNLPFFVKPRFRFDLPDPPMDPKMLLGHLSTKSFSKPFVSDIERDFRPIAIPSDPCYALRINLNVPAQPCNNINKNPSSSSPSSTSPYSTSHKLTIDDDALLQSVLNSRTNTKISNSNNINNINSNDRSNNLNCNSNNINNLNNSNLNNNNNSILNNQNSNSTQMQASSVSNAPWMRRMSYDEYAVSNSVNTSKRVPINSINPKSSALNSKLSSSHNRDNNLLLKEKRKKQLLASFTLVKQKPSHPNIRKSNLKPISVMPVFLDFKSLGTSFILLDFDKDEHLTVEDRVRDVGNSKITKQEKKEKQYLVNQSVQSLASVSIADSNQPRDDEPTKKYIACYTPTDSTLEKRTRKRKDAVTEEGGEEEEDGDSDNENDNENEKVRKRKKHKKIHFVEDESYERIGEYVIREGRYVESTAIGGDGVNRSCFAITQHESKDRRQRVACFERVATSWKLSRKPVDENVGQLSKEGLELNRQLDSQIEYEISDEWKKRIMCGKHIKSEKSQKLEKKEENLVDILEQD